MPLAFVCLGTGAYAQGPTINGCPAFPANSIYNTRIDSLPVHARSSAWISTINSVGGGPNHMHVLFGTQADNGMPINYVAGNSTARKARAITEYNALTTRVRIAIFTGWGRHRPWINVVQ